MPKDRLAELQEMSAKVPSEPSVMFNRFKVSEKNSINDLQREVELITTDIDGLEKEVNLAKKSYKDTIYSTEAPTRSTMEIRAAIIRTLATRVRESLNSLRNRPVSSSNTGKALATQLAALQRRFIDIMQDCHASQLAYQSANKDLIHRQLEVMGLHNYDYNLDMLLETGDLAIFVQSITQDRGKLNEVEERHAQILNLERDIAELNELMLDFAMTIEEQGQTMTEVEINVAETAAKVEAGAEEITKAKQNQRKYRKKIGICTIVLITAAIVITLIVLVSTGVF